MPLTYNQTEAQHTVSKDNPWYAIRTFNCQERKVSMFLTDKGCVHFIPMTITQSKVKEGEMPKRILVPAIHNLLFVQKTGTQQEMLEILKECTYPISIFRHPGADTPCEISAHDMIELRMLCDPQFQDTSVFMTQDEAENLIGKEVRVTVGPFKGSVGKLVRRNKQYYFLKIVTGLGIMVRISRWSCEPL
ncbi:MAG: UpxY family transcription antiterminator [Bacteroidaceae bacterium]|nr:UpxY family transcription antiterminator [Bacteroidaceae bacterium]